MTLLITFVVGLIVNHLSKDKMLPALPLCWILCGDNMVLCQTKDRLSGVRSSVVANCRRLEKSIRTTQKHSDTSPRYFFQPLVIHSSEGSKARGDGVLFNRPLWIFLLWSIPVGF